MGYKQVSDLCGRLKEDKTSVENDLRSGRPSTLRNEEMIAEVRTIDRNNRRLTVRDIDREQFAENDRKMLGWRVNPAPRQGARTHFTSCAAVFGQTQHSSVAVAAIPNRSRTV
jgi:hypothetical protein